MIVPSDRRIGYYTRPSIKSQALFSPYFPFFLFPDDIGRIHTYFIFNVWPDPLSFQ